MPASAMMGTEPVCENDRLIQKAINDLYPPIFSIAPPRGEVSHDDRSPGMIAGGSVAILFVILITGTRLWVRMTRSRAFGADDIVIIPATIGCLTFLAMTIAQETAGCLGRHLYDCTYYEFGTFYVLIHACLPIFYLTVFLLKISITLANRRITGLTSRKWQIAHTTYLVLLSLTGITCLLLNIFACSPVATGFSLQSIASQPDPRKIKCVDGGAVSLTTRYLHIVTDWLLLPVPLIILWRLQMRLSRKIRLMAVFAVGVISSGASIVRNLKTVEYANDLDVTGDYYIINAWDTVDIFFATIVASLPALNGLLDECIARVKTITSGSSTGKSADHQLRSLGYARHASDQYSVQSLETDRQILYGGPSKSFVSEERDVEAIYPATGGQRRREEMEMGKRDSNGCLQPGVAI